ncbi:MAG TPA: hypothetical protein VFM72_02465 [Aequorivita sp.]|nr:hypothetical protein [Aequorivita sp.]
MKRVEKHIGRLLVWIVFFLVTGNVAFAAESFSDKAKTTIVSELQKDDNKPFVYHEISIGEASQTVSQNEYLGLGLFGVFFSGQDFSFARVSISYNSSYSLKDKRELIFQHLFPFHFFW